MGMVFRTFLKLLYHIFYYGLSYKLCTNCVNPINLLGFMAQYGVFLNFFPFKPQECHAIAGIESGINTRCNNQRILFDGKGSKFVVVIVEVRNGSSSRYNIPRFVRHFNQTAHRAADELALRDAVLEFRHFQFTRDHTLLFHDIQKAVALC